MDFKTYLLKSGSRHGGHGETAGLGFGQPQGDRCLHVVHSGGGGVQEGSLEEKSPVNPSFFFVNAVLNIIPMSTPNNRSNPGTTIFISLAIGRSALSFTGKLRSLV